MKIFMMKDRRIHFSLNNRNSILLLIFVSALIVKLLIFFLVTDPIIFNKYPYFAERIAQGKDIGERLLDISPFYLFVNLMSYYIYGTNWEALVIFQIILGSLNCALVYLIGEKIFGKVIGVIAALFLILYHNLTIIDLTLEPESLLIFLNSLTILVLINFQESDRSKYRYWFALVAGMLIGLSVITKPNSLLFLIGALIWLLFTEKNIAGKLKSTALLLAGVFIFVAPVTARNYLKFNDVVMTTADGGKVFFHGNGPGANGMGRADLPFQGFTEEGMDDPDSAHALFRKTARAISGLPLKPSECSKFWFGNTLDYIKSNPAQWLSLELKKFYLFWNKYEVHDIDSNYKNYKTLSKMPLMNYGVISVLGILGMLLSLKYFRRAFLLYWMVFIYLGTTMIFFASSRYRIPAAPCMAVFAAFAVVYFFNLLKDKDYKKSGIFLSGLLVLGLLTSLPYRHEIAGYDQWQNATRLHYSMGANLFFKKGMYEKAIEELKITTALAPDFAPAYNLMGKSYAVLNHFEQAEINFRNVIKLAPELPEGYLNLGLLYRLKGDETKADYFLEKALSLNPDNEKIRRYIGK